MKSNYAVGDEENNLLLYNNLSAKPISMMNSQTSNVSSLTALTFANHDSQIIAGSNRGSINSWDIENAKSIPFFYSSFLLSQRPHHWSLLLVYRKKELQYCCQWLHGYQRKNLGSKSQERHQYIKKSSQKSNCIKHDPRFKNRYLR